MNKNEQIERETIQTAIENLEKTAGFKAIWEPTKTTDFDAILDIEVGKRLKFLVEAKTYIYFILEDSFSILVQAADYFELLEKYGENARLQLEEEGKNALDKDRYQKISDLKFEVCFHCRLAIISFLSFVEAFVNSVGSTYLYKPCR